MPLATLFWQEKLFHIFKLEKKKQKKGKKQKPNKTGALASVYEFVAASLSLSHRRGNSSSEVRHSKSSPLPHPPPAPPLWASAHHQYAPGVGKSSSAEKKWLGEAWHVSPSLLIWPRSREREGEERLFSRPGWLFFTWSVLWWHWKNVFQLGEINRPESRSGGRPNRSSPVWESVHHRCVC